MSATTQSLPSTPARAPAVATGIAIAVLWLAGAWALGTGGTLSADPSEPFRPVLLSIVVPFAALIAAFAAWGRFRRLVMGLDIRVLTLFQLWRVLGFAFLVLYAHDVLPGLFALPAGFGDLALGLVAPLMVVALARDPAFARSGRFLAFNILGIFDFAVAGITATLASGAFPTVYSGTLTSAAMEVWPLSLFPSFIVPLFLFAHTVVLLKVRALARQAA